MRGRRAEAVMGGTAPQPTGRMIRKGMSLSGGLVAALLLFTSLEAVFADSLAVDESAVGGVLRALEAPASTESPTVVQTDEGFIRFLGAPPGGSFQARIPESKSTGPQGIATLFLEDHGAAFGLLSESTNLRVGDTQSRGGSSFVRLNQYYGDIPVFGGQVVVQVNAASTVQNVMSDVMRDTRSLDDGSVSLEPTLSGGEALVAAINAFAAASSAHTPADFSGDGTPELLVLRPSVVGLSGATVLVWKVRISAPAPEPVYSEVLVDAHSGQLALQYSLLEHALDRQIFDADGAAIVTGDPVRVEGDPDTGISAVDNTYEFLGDTYNFYLSEHDYDSFDGSGATIVATVNYPFSNACWGCTASPSTQEEGMGDINEMLFGIGWDVDDIVAHELTHGVTQFTSGLIYFGFSGAINESFSDMWGEWVDQTNGSDNDNDTNRWTIGEEITEFGGVGFRNMKDPTIFGDPDRLGSPFLVDVTSFFDNGGVHINSGIGNKLCYLLTDGDTFNGQVIDGMGVSMAADLFFGTQFLLAPGSDYNDLYLALGAAAIEQGLTLEERLNIANAGKAVEIVPTSLFENGLRDFRATATTDTSGNPVVVLNWTNPDDTLYNKVDLLRSTTRFPSSFADGEVVATGTVAMPVSAYLDTDVVEGATYYYSLIGDLTSGLPQLVSAKATAGEITGNSLTEAFGQNVLAGDGRNTVDLAYSQLVFTPVGAPVGPLGSASGSGSFDNYEATFIPDAFALPVSREDSSGRALDITPPQDSGVVISLGDRSFPFFGQAYSQLYIAANGYISFQPISASDTLNFASLASHFAIPRISYFFAGAADLFDRLVPLAGGSMWLRELDDRIAVTYENVPQFNVFAPQFAGATSTVQVELYYTGRIRITYLDAVATGAVIGLSDGRGVPLDPATLFPGLVSAGGLTDLSSLPLENELLYLEPTPAATGDAGSLIEFVVTSVAPAGSATIPELTGSWNGPGGLRFADNRDGTGTFTWQTDIGDIGSYMLRVTAKADGQVAYQDIPIRVGSVLLLPEATELALIANEPGEDPTASRAVQTESALTAAYTYSHPLQTTGLDLFDEGSSLIYWYRNNQIVTSLTNRTRVSPQATRGGDRWYFGVVPVSLLGNAGQIAFSPTVTVSAIPEIVSVSPAVGSALGGEVVRVRGNRLGAPISVTFGGVAVNSIRAVSEGEIEVTTPLHAPGAVDVVVETTSGDGILRNGYTYLGEGASVAVTDVNGDGKIDALDVQLVVNAVLAAQASKMDGVNPDANRDGQVNATDIQLVVNKALLR